VCIATTISLLSYVGYLFVSIFSIICLVEHLYEIWKRLSKNENYEMQKNEVVIFISEIEIEEMEGIELK
jgi:hypothetical protein